MEDKKKIDFEHISNLKTLLIQETYALIEQVNNLLLTCIELVQLIHFKLVELIQPILVYIFPKTLVAYVQHESLKQVKLLFERTTLSCPNLALDNKHINLFDNQIQYC